MHQILQFPFIRLMLLLALLTACVQQPAPVVSRGTGVDNPPLPAVENTSAALMKNPLQITPVAGAGEEPAPDETGSVTAGAPLVGADEIILPVEALPEVNWSAPPECSAPPCPQVVVAQQGRIARADWSAQGFRAAPAAPSGLPEGTSFVIDTGTPSPDGKWAAYTTLGYETGGPVMLQNVESGELTNLIEAVNKRFSKDKAPLPEDFWWDVIGWFPDNTRLMLGPSDLSMVMIVNRRTFAAKIIPFAGSGKGGRMFVSLAPDGSQFFFVGEDAEGAQVLSAYNLKDSSVTEIQKIPYSEGMVMQPRFSPDGTSIAYIIQKGEPSSGLTWELDLLAAASGETRSLAQGNLAAAVPAWSPDGGYIAFTRDDIHPTLLAAPDAAPAPLRGNLWVVSLADGQETQVTSIDGLARSPAWFKDGRTLAFVTHDGQVGMANLDQPGQIWQAAGPTGEFPELTSAFFLP